MSLKQAAAGLAPKKRFRPRSLAVQLQEALVYAQSLEKLKAEDAAATSMRMLARTRIATLASLLKKKEGDKTARLTKALTELKAAKGEIERLKGELVAALAAKATKPVVPPISTVKQILAQHEAEKSAGGTQ